jgi:H+/Cl- antiporter ClcA
LYHYYGTLVAKGTNLVLEEYHQPQKTIPFILMPLVLATTLITHFVGGSAGREGTAVQMGTAISDQFSNLFQLENKDRKTILILGISAGFASVFGTPLAGALFALEVVYYSRINLKSVFLSFLTAYIAHYTVIFWQVEHQHYSIGRIPEINEKTLFLTLAMGIVFGLAALLFSKTNRFWSRLFSKHIAYSPFRPLVGGTILALLIYFTGSTKYIGLGLAEISASFSNSASPYDFLLKILFTTFTLGAGFKGGELTPLFFVGATLGSACAVVVPVPIALLAGMGFVAVFSGATHTPIACTVMGMELFGPESGLFIGVACFVAYFASGKVGIYSSQILKGPKIYLYQKVNSFKYNPF